MRHFWQYVRLLAAVLSLGVAAMAQEAVDTLPEARAGAPYEYTIRVEGGLAPLAWKLVNGELPPGIELSPAGVLRGQATAARVQPYKFEVEVRDSSEPPQKSTRWFSLAVRPAPLRIVPASEHLRIMPATEGSSGGSGSARDTVRTDEGAPPDNGSTPSKAAGKPADCSATTITGTPHHWDSSISGTMPEPKPGETVRIELQLDGRSQGVFTPMVDPSQCEFVVLLSHPLFEKQRARVRTVVNQTPGLWSAAVAVTEAKDEDACPEEITDCRAAFEAAAYLGIAVDTFASGETRKYLNPDAPSGPKERMIGGFDFDYRLVGQPSVRRDGKNHAWTNQLWIFGETVHGVRSTDINCDKNRTFLTCIDAGIGNVPVNSTDQIFFTIRNATSLEAFAGLRWEFASIQTKVFDTANLYLKGQAGFLTVAGSADDVKDAHHVALGAIATKGTFEGSYLEFGFGRTDLFAEKSRDRWKVDGFLSWPLPKTKAVRFFVQMTVDADLGSGADSIQSYFGFDFNLRKVSEWWSK